MRHERDTEIRDCIDCGKQYNLSQQSYYGPRCPECVAEKNPERTWPGCFKCSEKVDPDEAEMIKVRGAARDPTWVTMPAHPECAKDHTPRRHGP